MNYYEILGVSRNASTEEITAAFKKLVRDLHPDRYDNEDEKKEAERKFKEVTRAFNILKDPVKRREYDKTLASESYSTPKESKAGSEDYFKKGVMLYKAGDYENAEAYFQSAIVRGMATPQCYYYLALAQKHLPRRSKKVVENLEKAINLDPLNVKYRMELADFYLEKGVKSKAVFHYKRVLKIEPNNKKAYEILKSLGVVKSKTFFDKIFKSLFKRG